MLNFGQKKVYKGHKNNKSTHRSHTLSASSSKFSQLCKYSTGSKKVLQNKNQFWRFAMAFSVVLQRQSFMFLLILASLPSKWTTFARQKGYS